MLSTPPAPTVPVPWPTVQIRHGEIGLASTVISYASPNTWVVVKANVPLALIARSLPPWFFSVSPLPARPVTVPPTA